MSKNSDKKYINSTIKKLKQMGFSMTATERILGLPFRTMSRWQQGDFSKTSLAIITILNTHPGILIDLDFNRDSK